MAGRWRCGDRFGRPTRVEHPPSAVLDSLGPQQQFMDAQQQLPSIEELKAYYAVWFEQNYCIKPTANCTAVATFARAAMEHFNAKAPN